MNMRRADHVERNDDELPCRSYGLMRKRSHIRALLALGAATATRAPRNQEHAFPGRGPNGNSKNVTCQKPDKSNKKKQVRMVPRGLRKVYVGDKNARTGHVNVQIAIFWKKQKILNIEIFPSKAA